MFCWGVAFRDRLSIDFPARIETFVDTAASLPLTESECLSSGRGKISNSQFFVNASAKASEARGLFGAVIQGTVEAGEPYMVLSLKLLFLSLRHLVSCL